MAEPPESQEKASVLERVGAAYCKICPICSPARRWPNSLWARLLRGWRKVCPPCRAFEKVRRIRIAMEAAKDRPVTVKR